MARDNKHHGIILHQPSGGILMRTGVKFGAGTVTPSYGAELWVDEADHTGISPDYIYSSGTYSISKDADSQGDFASEALVADTNYLLTFDFARSGGVYPDYAIYIATNPDGLTIHLDLNPSTQPYSIPFTMPVSGTLFFTCPDIGWSGTYSNISLKEVL